MNIKWLLFLTIVSISITAHAMEKEAAFGRAKKNDKQLAKIKERTAYAQAFIGNIDKVLQKNGFTEKSQKATLKEIRTDLTKTDVSSQRGLEGFYEYARYATVVLKGLGTEDNTYYEQIFCLGTLSLMAAECSVKNADKMLKRQFALEQQKLQKDANQVPCLLEDSLEISFIIIVIGILPICSSLRYYS